MKRCWERVNELPDSIKYGKILTNLGAADF
jgi:hypothetical protein